MNLPATLEVSSCGASEGFVDQRRTHVDPGHVVVRKIIAAFSPLCAATTFSRLPVEIRRVHQWLR
jgi:hypothetical protein